LQEIVDVYAAVLGQGVDIGNNFGGLPAECFQNAESEILEGGGWVETVLEPENVVKKKLKLLKKSAAKVGSKKRSEDVDPGVFGLMHHAFPRTKMKSDTSWARNRLEKQYLLFISDGDLGMLNGVGRGMGGGLAFDNRSGMASWINGCGFHKPAAMERNATVRRYLQDIGSFDHVFGSLVEECIHTDCPEIGRTIWRLVLLKCDLYGLPGLREHFERYHNPVTGRQGVWGRWNHVQEEGLAELQCGECAHPAVPTTEHPMGKHTVHDVTRGTAGTSNPLEGRMNKALGVGLNQSWAYGTLVTKAQHVLTNLGKDMANLGFSLVPDHQGECVRTSHTKKSGRKNSQKTGRNYKQRLQQAVVRAHDKQFHVYNYRVSGQGRTAEYYCASDVTRRSITDWFVHHDVEPTPDLIRARVKVLRDIWVLFRKNPRKHFDDITQVRYSNNVSLRTIELTHKPPHP
jgi:hypothetical protein